MARQPTTTKQQGIVRRKNRFLRRLLVCLIVLIVSTLVTLPILYFQAKKASSVSMSQITSSWKDGNYQATFDLTDALLNESPYHAMALTYHGYSGFYLAVSQTDTVKAQTLLDEAINSLRVATLKTRSKTRTQVYYMLGKAYFYKNTLSSYNYYSDLAIKYLALAKQERYEADDIPELLGLSYAALDMTEESIASFTEALIVRESDVLLLSIAEQYYNNKQFAAAKAYLHRVSTTTADDSIRLRSKSLLGKIYIDESNYEEAEKEYRSILEIDPNYADAFYGIGVIYESKGELVRARSEWRKTLRLDVNHQGAKIKLSE